MHTTDFRSLKGLKEELTEDISSKVVQHRNIFRKLIVGRYLEMLPSLISYKIISNSGMVLPNIDYLKLEYGLRKGYFIVVGLDNNKNLRILGFYHGKNSTEDSSIFYSGVRLTKNDIDFFIPKEEQLPVYQEITYADNCSTGNFVVLRNKTINLINDYEILDHYADEISEIICSRFSLSIQAKMMTFLVGEYGDETINQIATAMYNGQPYVKVSKLFDPQEQILSIQNNASQNLVELKREYQNKLSELNNMLGINSLAVEKTSGVSQAEVNGNHAYTTANANIYLESRNRILKKLEKRYLIKIRAYYNSDVASMMNGISTYENDNNTK